MPRHRFQVWAPGASSVLLAGSFNGWKGTPLAPDPATPGLLTTPLDLPPGLQEYKLIVDDRWRHDEGCPLRRGDGFGGLNSVLLSGGPPPPAPGSLRVLSLNLHTHQEPDPLRRIEEVALVAAALGVELFLLQEVAEHLSDPALPNAGGVLLGHMRHLSPGPWVHAWQEAHRGFDVFREGLSIVSRRPLREVTAVPLSGGPLARVALLATVDHGGAEVRVGTLHTTWPPAGSPEVEALLEALPGPGAGPPVLLAGDLNGGPSAAHVRRLLAAGFRDHGGERGLVGATFLAPPRERIDYQLSRPGGGVSLACRGQWRLFGGDDGLPRVSDHAALLGDFALA